MIQRIVCAAVRHRGGRVVCGPRHFDVTMWSQILGLTQDEMIKALVETRDLSDVRDWGDAEQGFIDQHGTFLSRETAWGIAQDAGQIIREQGWQTGCLHSEHLY